MADFPSFSLGLGLSSDEEEELHCKDGGGTQLPTAPEQEPDFPSFDLFPEEAGLDFDQIRARDLDLDCQKSRAFKRLRRGTSSVSSTIGTETPPRVSLPKKEFNQTGGRANGSEIFSSLDDEIEEFSSQEEAQVQDQYMRSVTNDAYSSSKMSLRNQGVLTSQYTTKIKPHKITPNSISSTFSNLEKSDKTKLLPKLTISPLRKIHVLDTDSDSDPNPSSDFAFDQNKNESETVKEQKEKASMAMPAFDEFCKEYFRTENDQNIPVERDEAGTSVCTSRVFNPVEFTKDFEDILPKQDTSSELASNDIPCYKYFYHSDARIRDLVRERLPHFTPLGAANDKDNAHNGRDNIDYMRQFGQKESAKSRRSKNTAQKDSTPKDVGKRRVQACGQKAGQWYTQDGKRVYVTKQGKELTGQLAYRQYRRESGAKYRRAKKQGSGSRKKGR